MTHELSSRSTAAASTSTVVDCPVLVAFIAVIAVAAAPVVVVIAAANQKLPQLECGGYVSTKVCSAFGYSLGCSVVLEQNSRRTQNSRCRSTLLRRTITNDRHHGRIRDPSSAQPPRA